MIVGLFIGNTLRVFATDEEVVQQFVEEDPANEIFFDVTTLLEEM